jgi:GH25 family lysozyme M1 (1,4-beta-N-acetylmuramidase)
MFESLRSWLRGGALSPSAYNSGKPFGIDISSYQGRIVPAMMTYEGVSFIGIRASIGLQADSNFPVNWRLCKEQGMIRFAYHAIRPDLSMISQVNLFKSLLGDDQGELPPCIDIERRDGQTNATISDKVYGMWDALSTWYGGAAIIYSSAYYADQLMIPASWYERAWWWLAHYLTANPITGYAEEHPGPPALPRGVPRERVLIHQTAGKGQGGDTMGVESKNLDYDRYQFDLAHLYRLAREVSPPAPLTLEQKVSYLASLHGLNF